MFANFTEGWEEFRGTWQRVFDIGTDPLINDAGRLWKHVENGHKQLYALHKFDAEPEIASLLAEQKPRWDAAAKWAKASYLKRWLPSLSPLNRERRDNLTATLTQLSQSIIDSKADGKAAQFRNLLRDAEEIIETLGYYKGSVDPPVEGWIDRTLEEWDKFREIVK